MAIYHQDIIDIELNSGNIFRSFLKHSIGLGDAAANRFGVRVLRDGEPETLSEVTCQGYFQNANGENIALTSYGTISGNEAYVTLPQACYNVEGRFTLAIKLVGGGVTGTMRIVDGAVDNTNTSSAVAPTGSVPTYQEVLSVFEQMQTAVSNYDAKVTEQDGKISDLTSALNGSVDSLYMNPVDIVWYQGSIRTNGTNVNNTACCRTDMLALGEHPVAFLKPADWLFYIVEYSTNVVSGFTRIITPVYASGDYIFSPVSGYYYRIVVKKQSGADFTPADSDLANIALTVSENASEIVLNARDGIAISANDDLDDYVTAGRYISRNTAITETLLNSPFADTGFDLIVISTSDRTSGEYVRQIAFKNNRDNPVYTRYKTTTWGEWQQVGDLETAPISANDNLDNYIIAGRYSAANTAVTKTLINCPLPNTGFDMIVTRTTGHDDGTYIRQIIIKNSKTDNSIFVRYKGLTWGDWQRISMVSSKLPPLQMPDVSINALPARNTRPAKLTINVGTFNVARFNHDTDIYLADEPERLLDIRNWLNDHCLDILFTQEDTGYIDSGKSKTAFDYLFKAFFNANPTNSGNSADVARANKKIYSTLAINTNGTVVSLDNNANPPAVYPSGHIYAGQTITAYFVWVKQTIPDVGDVMLIDLHNFYNGAANSQAEWHPYQNRGLFLDNISAFLAEQTYDYCIIAGDFNTSNYDGRTASGAYAPISEDAVGDWTTLLNFCTDNNLIPCNGGALEWFRTNPSKAVDNILVSNNIRIERVECDPDIREVLYSDHAPIVARISFT